MPERYINKWLIYRSLNSYDCLILWTSIISVHKPKFNHISVYSNISIIPFWHDDIHPTILCCYTKYLQLCEYTDMPFWHDALNIIPPTVRRNWGISCVFVIPRYSDSKTFSTTYYLTMTLIMCIKWISPMFTSCNRKAWEEKRKALDRSSANVFSCVLLVLL